jgi:ERCC4-type nuclease
MTGRPWVEIDIDERKCAVPGRLAGLGAVVRAARLAAGDYVVGPGTVVERKSMPDLHDSVLRGRFWGQLGKLRAASRFAYLLVEGDDLDDGPLRGNAIRGVLLATLEQRIRVLRSRDQDDSAVWIHRLAVRCQRSVGRRDRPLYAQGRRPASDDPGEAMLAAVPGISTDRARALLDRFGSVAGVAGADRRTLQEVAGIGPANATSL